ncbi:NAC domain-containing protein 74-like [Lolium rigidum]|uniref:NAC domain-containing protein 74-like n=1 Tax=Lolium rigidum TaxID=89674 RepID=UPI001F5CC55C|nr:NAC domain-containing protein 74-like [Lolium rigidum]
METLRDMALPPGFGFHPKDTELVSHYLKKKVLGQKIEYDIIPEVDIYKHEPWDLPGKCNVPTQDNKWHFFAARDRKYPNGARSNRATVAGYWKSTGKDRAIKVDKRTIGTKKTLVFHEGRPPTGKRTEWIMHEYYIDENECQACPDMKDTFVLCKVTQRTDWTSENGNVVGNNNHHPQQSNVAATSAVSVEQQDAAASSVVGAERPSDVATLDTAAQITTPDGDDGIQEWLEELIDTSFDPSLTTVVDSVSAGPSPDEQIAESSNIGAMALKMEPDYASPNQIGVDDTDFLLPDDIHAMLYPGTDDFNSWHAEQAAVFAEQTYFTAAEPFTLPNNFADGFQMEELQLPLENNEPSDNGITLRMRDGKAPADSTPQRRSKAQRALNRMVMTSSESINQTVKFVDNNGHLDLMTNVKHQRKHVRGITSVEQSDAGKSSSNDNNQGFLRGVGRAFRGCSAVGLNILIAVCMVGVAAAILHHGRHRGAEIIL